MLRNDCSTVNCVTEKHGVTAYVTDVQLTSVKRAVEMDTSEFDIVPTQQDSEDSEYLIMRARSLTNGDLGPLMNIINQDSKYKTPARNAALYFANSNVKYKSASSAKDSRKEIRKEWETLKNCSKLNDDSIDERLEQLKKSAAEKEILNGVAAYIEIENKHKIPVLKSLLTSMGASIYDSFTNEVTHIVFKNGSLNTYKRAKLLNVHLVSIFWVEECKKLKTKLSEKLFPVFFNNEYVNSPRIFRKFMEHQSRNFEYDENDGTLIRKTQKKKELILNMEKLNIANEDININAPNEINDKENYNLSSENDSSQNSFRLYLSSDSEANNSPNKHINDENSSSPREHLIPEERLTPEKRLTPKEYLNSAHSPIQVVALTSNKRMNDNGNETTSKTANKKSPVKRKLFAKHPLLNSFIKFSQDNTEILPTQEKQDETVVINPYHINDTRKQKNESRALIPIVKKPQFHNENIKKVQLKASKTSPCKHSIKHKKRVLVTTHLHSDENRIIKEIVKKLQGFIFKTTVDEHTTHVVAGEPRRTVNMLKGIARGCWILRIDWITDSANAGHWLAEEQFEMTEFSKTVQRSRIQKQAFGKSFGFDIFDECGIVYINQNCEPSYKDLCELVVLCGGKTSMNSDKADISVGEVIRGKQCVSEKWILDSITFGRIKTISHYPIITEHCDA